MLRGTVFLLFIASLLIADCHARHRSRMRTRGTGMNTRGTGTRTRGTRNRTPVQPTSPPPDISEETGSGDFEVLGPIANCLTQCRVTKFPPTSGNRFCVVNCILVALAI